MQRSKSKNEGRGVRLGRMRWTIVAAVAAAGALACAAGLAYRGWSAARDDSSGKRPAAARATGPILLDDVTDRTGITFRHTHGGTGKRYIVETVASGLALFDYDADGDDDIYFLNGAPLPLGRKVDRPPTSALYRNDGHFRFTDVTRQAGVGDRGYGLGAAVGDYDNDGRLDLYVNNFGPNVLYRNNGDGTFFDVTARAGVARGEKIGAGASFLDIDADGDLDLFVANYVAFSYEQNPYHMTGGFLRYPGPLDFPAQPNQLFRNNGDGTFTEVTAESGIGAHAGSGMGLVDGDFDNDGDIDLFVCNDVKGNFLFRNDGAGKFEEVALAAGVAYDSFGKASSSMGTDAADYDNDGWFDLVMTDYQAETPCLYHNLGEGVFEEIGPQAGIGTGTFQHINWGCGWADFDNDGRRDLYVANGHIEPLIDQMDPTTAYRAPDAVFHNLGDGTFLNVSDAAGSGLAVRAAGRGLGLGDLDGDGRIDVVVLNSDDRPTILRNVTRNENHWLQLDLRGAKTNRAALGARVRVTAGDLVQIDEVRSGRGYQSHFGLCLHFGLGRHARADTIEVRWLGGGTDKLENVAADRRVTITEGKQDGVVLRPQSK